MLASLLMIPILAALSSGLCFVGMQIVMKRNALNDKSPLIIPSLFGCLSIVWALLLITTHATGILTYNFSLSALVFPIGWAICTTTTTSLFMWLITTYSLTEAASYRKAIMVFGTMAVDILLFHISFPLGKLAAITCILSGALVLSHSQNRMPSPKQWLILVLWCGMMVLQVTLYKEGLQLQPHVLSNTIVAQLASTIIYSLFCLAPSVRAEPLPGHKALYALLLLALAGTLIEGFAYAGLPLAIVTVTTLLPAALFAAHDLWNGDLSRNRRTLGAIAMLVAGFALLVFTH